MKTGIIVLTAFEGDVKISTSSSEQAPWDVAPDKLAEMKTEPSKSKTAGYLEYGDIITGVKKLKPASSLELFTPLSTAEIRGTDFKVKAEKNSNGTPKTFTVGVASGEVGVCSAGGGNTLPVAAGSSSTVSMSPSQTGQPGGTISQPTTSPLSVETGSGILSSVSSQRSSGQAVFAKAVLATALAADIPEAAVQIAQSVAVVQPPASPSTINRNPQVPTPTEIRSPR